MSSPKFKRLYLWLSIISAAFLLSVIAMMIFSQDDWTETVIGDLLYPLWNLVTVAVLRGKTNVIAFAERGQGLVGTGHCTACLPDWRYPVVYL
jgi:hypothetical protein